MSTSCDMTIAVRVVNSATQSDSTTQYRVRTHCCSERIALCAALPGMRTGYTLPLHCRTDRLAALIVAGQSQLTLTSATALSYAFVRKRCAAACALRHLACGWHRCVASVSATANARCEGLFSELLLLRVACCMLHVACCMLRVACCMLHAVYHARFEGLPRPAARAQVAQVSSLGRLC